MKPGDLIRWKNPCYKDLFLVIKAEPPPNDENDVYTVQNITRLGTDEYAKCFEHEVEVISETG